MSSDQPDPVAGESNLTAGFDEEVVDHTGDFDDSPRGEDDPDLLLETLEIEPTHEVETVEVRDILKEDARPGVPKIDPILVADHISRSFGGITAVDVEHVEIPRHAITALIGPNGAGKTTFFNLLSGFDKPDTGSWEFNGRSLAGVPAFKTARRGQVRTFQLTKVLHRLTVLESMKLGATGQRGESIFGAVLPFLWSSQEREIEERALELLDRFKLLAKKDDYSASLSGGQRKLLEMARALMTEPEFVLLDEPMAGVNPALVQSLLDHVIDLKAQGMTVLFVEHDMHMVRHIADWVVVMAEGKVVAEGPPDEVMQDPAVVDAYLGSHLDDDIGVITGRYDEEGNRVS